MVGVFRGVLAVSLISKGSALNRAAAEWEDMLLPKFVLGWETTKLPEAAFLVIRALLQRKENFFFRHKGCHGSQDVLTLVWKPLRRFVFPARVFTASFSLQGLQFMGVVCVTRINCQCSNVELEDLRTGFSQRWAVKLS